MCSGVVPQQPPTEFTLYSSRNRRIASRNGFACSGYSVRPSTRIGRPAFGSTLIERSQFLEMYAMCSAISTGPVAQLRPSEAIGNGLSALTTAAMSEPSSIVPVVSMVTLEKIARSSGVRPASLSASMQALIAIFCCSRSCEVSIMKPSMPPAIRPRACSR